ncbi:uncharacterized protein [Haliotis cracherodii]|uniref:uncharacterized protein n=1 Tax=Haliotis cracherodii TaxID=6455 RepID=UPI0039EBA0BB
MSDLGMRGFGDKQRTGNVEYVHRLRSIARELDKKQRCLDLVKVGCLIVGVIGSGLIFAGFVWTFVNYTQSLNITLSGSIIALAGSAVSYAVNVGRNRHNNNAVKEALGEITSFEMSQNHFKEILELFCEMSTGPKKKYPFQYTLLTLLPVISLLNSIHDLKYTASKCTGVGDNLAYKDKFDGLSAFGKGMEIVDVAVAVIGLCANTGGLIYYCYKTYRYREARVPGIIRDVATSFYY